MAEIKIGLDDYRLTHSIEELNALPTIDLDDPIFLPHVEEYGKWKQGPDNPPAQDIGLKHLTDLGNGERLAHRQRDDSGNYLIHYSNDVGWRYWDGARWKVDTTSDIQRRAWKAIRQIPLEANNLPKEEYEKVVTWAFRSESAARLEAMVNMAKIVGGISVEADIWDADNFLINFRNGTIDLNTGVLRSHRREDYITRCLDYDFDPSAECPVWDKFLQRVQPDEQTRDYLLKAAAYCLSGSIDEQCVFILHGEGENGKTKFLQGIFHALGGDAEYAGVMRTESLMIQKNNNDTAHEIAMLKGKRFVYAVEPNSNSTFNSSFIKQQTGGEQVMGRHMYKDFFSFMPTHKLWIGANHDVKLIESDHGIQRRLKQTPFGVVITAEEKDGDLETKLKAERQGIMAQLVRYWIRYRKEGLGMPPEVVRETSEYFQRVNPLKPFLDECCSLYPSATDTPSNLHNKFVEWSKTAGDYKPMKRNTFYSRLKEQGFARKTIAGSDFFVGITLKGGDEPLPWNER